MPSNKNTLSLSRQDALSLTLSRSRTHTQSKYNTYIECPANFFEYPAVEDRFPFILGSKLRKGDLHSNAINFIYFLIKQNLINIPEGQYNRLLNIYYKSRLAVEDADADLLLSAADIDEFEKIVTDATINPDLLAAILKDDPHLLTTLCNLSGDETSDRGLDDILILIILKKLFDSKIPYLINASNHGMSFYHAYEQNFETFKPFGLENPLQARSLTHLGDLVECGVVSKEKLIEYTEKYYKPFLVLSNHSYDEVTDSLTISVHALAGPKSQMELAKAFGVPSEFKNNKEWAASLDQINSRFAILKDKKIVTEFYNEPAIYKLIWNEEYEPGDTPADLPAGCQNVHFIHGHSSKDEKESEKYPNVTNLDSEHGKSDLLFIGPYKAYYEGPAPLKKPDFTEKNANYINPIDALSARIEQHKNSQSYSKFKLEKNNKIEREAAIKCGPHASVDEKEEYYTEEFNKELTLLIIKARKDINKLRKLEENEEYIHQNLEQLKKDYKILKIYLLNLVTFTDGKLNDCEDLWFLQILAESQYEKYERLLANQKKMGDSKEIETKSADDTEAKLQEYLAQVESYKTICKAKFTAYESAIHDAENEAKPINVAKSYRLAASELTSAIDQLTTIKRILVLANSLGLQSLMVWQEMTLVDAKLLEYKTIKGNLQPKINSAELIESILNEPSREDPRKGLKDYISRIEKNKLNGEINFKYGFWIMKDSRAANRKATYDLAKELLTQLDEPDTDVKSIFNGAASRRNMLFSSKIYKNRDINSKTMKQVINSVIKPR